MAAAEFWHDQDRAQTVIQRANQIKVWLEPITALRQDLEAVAEILPDALELADQELLSDCQTTLERCEQQLAELELKRMLSGEMDRANCYLTVNAGAGGTESCDWVAMLVRMYQRWGQRRGWRVDWVDHVDGEVAGFKSVTLKLSGDYAYGYARAERGVHRLVRISPFDSNARRHTSFAAVDVSPEVPDDIQVEIRSEDLRVDTFRASGAGGQHVNRTDSAVRITHIPSGIVVSCQAERSQLQNKETCLAMLRAKLYEKECAARAEKLKALGGEKQENAWGSQIRSYVFQPYTLVKDNRTKLEIGNIEAVMDGEIDALVTAYLKQQGGA